MMMRMAIFSDFSKRIRAVAIMDNGICMVKIPVAAFGPPYQVLSIGLKYARVNSGTHKASSTIQRSL